MLYEVITLCHHLGAMLLTACDEGSLGTASQATTSSPVTFDGSVGDGPVVGATVTIRDRNLEVIATTTSDQQASFNFTGEIADSAFPLIVEATYGIDLVTNAEPDFIRNNFV